MRKFTLIELIIVIVVLGVLAAIVIPNVSNTKEEAQVISMEVNENNLQMAVDLFRLENDKVFPTDERPTMGNPQFIDFNVLKPNYIRQGPEEGGYYWMDYRGIIWSSTVLTPNDFEVTESGISWSKSEGAEKYDVYEAVSSTSSSSTGLKYQLVMSTTEIQAKPEGFSADKHYAVSAVDKHGKSTPPSNNGFYGEILPEDLEEEPKEPEPEPEPEVIPDPIQPFMKNKGGSGRGVLEKFIETSDGNYLAVGNSNSTDGDVKGKGYGGFDFAFVKFTPEGEVI